MALAPSDPLCLHNLSVIHYERVEIDESIDCAERALLMNPDLAGAHFARAEALLIKGDWEHGWEEYEWRFRIADAAKLMPPTDKPQWDGTPFTDGTLLLVADQGFGDVIQFSRYIPWVLERCPDVVIACSSEMVPVLRQFLPEDRIFFRWEACPPYKAFAALSGLPRLHGTRVDAMLGSDPVSARRSGPCRDLGGAVAAAGTAFPSQGRHRLGGTADAQQRPAPVIQAGGFFAVGGAAGRGACVATERTVGGSGGKLFRAGAVDQHRRRSP